MKTQPATRTHMIEVLRALQEDGITNAEFEKFHSAAGAGETWHPNLADTIKHYEERIKGHELGPKSAEMLAPRGRAGASQKEQRSRKLTRHGPSLEGQPLQDASPRLPGSIARYAIKKGVPTG